MLCKWIHSHQQQQCKQKKKNIEKSWEISKNATISNHYRYYTQQTHTHTLRSIEILSHMRAFADIKSPCSPYPFRIPLDHRSPIFQDVNSCFYYWPLRRLLLSTCTNTHRHTVRVQSRPVFKIALVKPNDRSIASSYFFAVCLFISQASRVCVSTTFFSIFSSYFFFCRLLIFFSLISLQTK